VFIPLTARTERKNRKNRTSKKCSKDTSASMCPRNHLAVNDVPDLNVSLVGQIADLSLTPDLWQAAVPRQKVQLEGSLTESASTLAQAGDSSLAASSLAHQTSMQQTMGNVELILQQMGPEAAAAVAAIAARVAGPAGEIQVTQNSSRACWAAAPAPSPRGDIGSAVAVHASALQFIPEDMHRIDGSYDNQFLANQMSSSCPSLWSLKPQLSNLLLTNEPCSSSAIFSSSCPAYEYRIPFSHAHTGNQINSSNTTPTPNQMRSSMANSYSSSSTNVLESGMNFAAGSTMVTNAAHSPPAPSFFEEAVSTVDLGWSKDPVLPFNEGSSASLCSFNHMSSGLLTSPVAEPCYNGSNVTACEGMAGIDGLLVLIGDDGIPLLGSSPQGPASSLWQSY
jgi:hypothetical protein